MSEIDELSKCLITYKGVKYYFVSDINEITDIHKSYIYLLLKKKKVDFITKEGIKLINAESFNDYLLSRSGSQENTIKAELIKKIKSLSDTDLKKIEKLFDK